MKNIISTSNAPAAIGPYSQAVEINGILFVSGQIPVNPKTGEVVNSSIEEATNQIFQNIADAPVDFKIFWRLGRIHILSAVKHFIHIEILFASQQRNDDI